MSKYKTDLAKILVTIAFMGITTVVLFLDLNVSAEPTIGEVIGLGVIIFLYAIVLMSGIIAYFMMPRLEEYKKQKRGG